MKRLAWIAVFASVGCTSWDGEVARCVLEDRCYMPEFVMQPLWPTNSAPMGAGRGGQLELSWLPVGQYASPTHEVQATPCEDLIALDACDFRASTTTTQFAEGRSATVYTTFGRSRPQRIAWRVRGCTNDTGAKQCGAWSPVRYVKAGHPSGPLRRAFGQDGTHLVIGSQQGPIGYRWSGTQPEYGWMLGGSGAAYQVAGAGDVNGDGLQDVVFSDAASRSPGTTSRAHLVLGTYGYPANADTAALLETGSDGYGTSVGSAGDFNGDGLADTLVGDPYGRQVKMYLGGGTDWGSRLVRLIPSGAGSAFPLRLGTAGDLNGDGYDEVWATDEANVYVFFGLATGGGAQAQTWAAPGGPNGSAAGVGDMDGDGFEDLVVVQNDGTAGIFYGGPEWLASGNPRSRTVSVSGRTIRGVAAVGDVSLDAVPDFVLQLDTSELQLFFGGTGDPYPSINYNLPSPITSLVGIGDLDGDGPGEIAVGQADSQSVVVLHVPYGTVSGRTHTVSMTVGVTDFGWSVASSY